jgi:hypothetical protein
VKIPRKRTTTERRRWPRVSVSEGNLFLQWQTECKDIEVNGLLIDISQGGALVISPILIPERELIQVALKDGSPKTWLDARVVGIIEHRRWSQIRLEFLRPCPDLILRAAIRQCVACQLLTHVPPATTGQ